MQLNIFTIILAVPKQTKNIIDMTYLLKLNEIITILLKNKLDVRTNFKNIIFFLNKNSKML